MGGGEVARYIAKPRVQGAGEQGDFHFGRFHRRLLKSADNPEGVDETVFTGIEKAIVADRFSFVSDAVSSPTFITLDVYRGKRITDQAVQMSWNVAAIASPKGTLDLRVGVARGFSHGSQEVRSLAAGHPRRRGSHRALFGLGTAHCQAGQRRRTRGHQGRPAQHRLDARRRGEQRADDLPGEAGSQEPSNRVENKSGRLIDVGTVLCGDSRPRLSGRAKLDCADPHPCRVVFKGGGFFLWAVPTLLSPEHKSATACSILRTSTSYGKIA